jgi:predicted Zn-dependent peptidase
MSRAVGAVYIYDAQPAEFAVYINGSQLDPARGLSAVQGIIAGLSAKPMNADTLKRYRTIAHGQWATEDISLADRAFAIGNFVAFGAAPDSGARVAAAIDTVSAADVQRAAVAYLEKFTVALIIPRNSAPAKPAG